MALGSMNHLALVASDFARSCEFYDHVLKFMGYERVEMPEHVRTLMKTPVAAWASPNCSITLRPAKSIGAKPYDRYAPGLNHFAFNAERRDDVDRFGQLLEAIGATVLDPPAEYPYAPGYYAVYCADPDGIKMEFVYWPRS
ncbi:MAG: VOC family protein [Candidatus Binataceae bacterium]